MKKLVLLAFLGLSIALTSSGQELLWESTNGPYGGSTNNFQAGPGGLVFATFTEFEDGNITYAIYRSTDYGNSWLRTSLDGSTGWVIGVSSQGVGFAEMDDKFYRSSDKGDTWMEFVLPTDARIFSIIEGDSNKLFAAGEDLFFSDDSGETWVLTDTTRSLNIDVNSRGDLLRVSNNQLQLSNDDGSTWSVINEEAFLNYVDVFVVNNEDEIILGSYELYKISPDGSTYERVSEGIKFEQLVVSPSGTIIGRVYLASAIISTDNGNTWEHVGDRIPSHFENVFAVSHDSVFYASTVEGLYSSHDDGETWDEAFGGLFHANILEIASDNEGSLYAITETRLVKKDSESDEWETLFYAGLDEYFTDLVANSEGDIFVITHVQRWDKSTLDSCSFEYCDRLYRSTDGGQTWDVIRSLMFISDVEIASNGDIYIASSFGLMKSTDNGQSWEDVPDEGLSFFEVTVAGDGQTMYGLNWDGYFMTDDGGSTWTVLSIPGFTNDDLQVNSTGDLFSITYTSENEVRQYSLNISSDMGETWDDISPVTGVVFFDLYIDKYDNLYLGSGEGTFRSIDNGSTWQDLGDQIIATNIIGDDEGTIYSSTIQAGVWRSTNFVPVKNILLSKDDLQVYPNPARDNILVEYTGVKATDMLKLYDTKGQMVKETPMNQPSITLNISDMKKGIYLLKIGEESRKVVIY